MFGTLNLLSIIASLFILIAVALLLFAIFILVTWMWRGGDGILFPGLGLIVSTPAFVILLLILAIGSIIVAGAVSPKKDNISQTETTQNFDYPNDIYSGCGNGTLDLSLEKNLGTYNEKTDRRLNICINDDDIESILDTVVAGRKTFENLDHEEFQKAVAYNKELQGNFASRYPFLGRINDMYEDYSFSPEELPKLREECLKLLDQPHSKAANLALRKFLHACDEAIKGDYYLMFYCD